MKEIRTLEARIRQRIRTAINKAFQIPSVYTSNIHQSIKGAPSPSVRNTLIIKVKINIKVIALRERNTMLKGILERKTIRTVKASAKANEARLLQKKIDTIKIVARSILVANPCTKRNRNAHW